MRTFNHPCFVKIRFAAVLLLLIVNLIATAQSPSSDEANAILMERLSEYANALVVLEKNRKNFLNLFYDKELRLHEIGPNPKGLNYVDYDSPIYFYEFMSSKEGARYQNVNFSFENAKFFRGEILPANANNLKLLFPNSNQVLNIVESVIEKIRKEKHDALYIVKTAIQYQHFVGKTEDGTTVSPPPMQLFLIWLLPKRGDKPWDNIVKKSPKNGDIIQRNVKLLFVYSDNYEERPKQHIGNYTQKKSIKTNTSKPVFSSNQINSTREASKNIVREYYRLLQALPFEASAEGEIKLLLNKGEIPLVNDFLNSPERQQAKLKFRDTSEIVKSSTYLKRIASSKAVVFLDSIDKIDIKTGIEPPDVNAKSYYHICKVPINYTIIDDLGNVEVRGHVKFTVTFGRKENGEFTDYRISEILPDGLTIDKVTEEDVDKVQPNVTTAFEGDVRMQGGQLVTTYLKYLERIAVGQSPMNNQEWQHLYSLFEGNGRNVEVGVSSLRELSRDVKGFVNLRTYLEDRLPELDIEVFKTRVVSENLCLVEVEKGKWVGNFSFVQYFKSADYGDCTTKRIRLNITEGSNGTFSIKLADSWPVKDGTKPLLDCENILSPRP